MVSSTPAGSGLPIGLMPGALPSDHCSRQTLNTTAMRLLFGHSQSAFFMDGAPLASRAAAIISPSRATLIGSELTTMPSGAHRVVDRARDRRRRAEIAALARALLAEHGVRRRRPVMHDLDRRHLVRGRQQVIHEALRHQLAVVVVGELLVAARRRCRGRCRPCVMPRTIFGLITVPQSWPMT